MTSFELNPQYTRRELLKMGAVGLGTMLLGGCSEPSEVNLDELLKNPKLYDEKDLLTEGYVEFVGEQYFPAGTYIGQRFGYIAGGIKHLYNLHPQLNADSKSILITDFVGVNPELLVPGEPGKFLDRKMKLGGKFILDVEKNIYSLVLNFAEDI